MSLDKDAVEFLSRERGIDPAYIEKDWHAVRLLALLSNLTFEDFTIIFTGGTSLSKGYGLIERFSEDLDFRPLFKGDGKLSQGATRRLRKSLIADLIEQLPDDLAIDEARIQKYGAGFKLWVTYPKLFNLPDGLRPDLQIDFTFTQPCLGSEQREIASFVSDFKGEAAETSILCLSPIEIAADKFGALTWRVIKRDRDDARDDPAMLRHLHDLCALAACVNQQKATFIEIAKGAFEDDQAKPSRAVGKDIFQAANQALQMLRDDDRYRGEYEQFVDEMSYANDENRIGFDMALMHFEQLISYL